MVKKWTEKEIKIVYEFLEPLIDKEGIDCGTYINADFEEVVFDGKFDGWKLLKAIKAIKGSDFE